MLAPFTASDTFDLSVYSIFFGLVSLFLMSSRIILQEIKQEVKLLQCIFIYTG